MQDEKALKWYAKHGKTPPEHINHGLDPDSLREKLQRLTPYSWKLRGNQLEGMTAMGPLVQTIPTDYILTGTDEDGLPILTKVQL